MLDSISCPTNFQNEIIWKRSSAHSDTTQGATHLGRTHDTILFYGKGPTPRRNIVTVPFDKDYVESHYRDKEPRTGRRFRLGDLTSGQARRGHAIRVDRAKRQGGQTLPRTLLGIFQRQDGRL